jgi:serine/threonine protein kinase
VRAEVPTYTKKVDIWALGCILYETMFKRKAFYNDYAVREYSFPEGTLRLPLEPTYYGIPTTSLMPMISKMLEKDPHKRPSARNIAHELDSFHIAVPPTGTFEFLGTDN